MVYKRQEGFRFVFDPPINGIYKVMKINNVEISSSYEVMSIIDISPKGAKLEIDLDFLYSNTTISIAFKLNKKGIHLTGQTVWKKGYAGRVFYGIKFNENSYSETELLKEIKSYSKLMRKN